MEPVKVESTSLKLDMAYFQHGAHNLGIGYSG